MTRIVLSLLAIGLLACSSTPASTAADLSTAPQPDAGAACQAFCTCMATNCPSETFAPQGCLGACAAGTKWDLPCRMNMCSLVPAQPANDHCTHAAGRVQCLDMP